MSPEAKSNKKRRLQGACDICRRQKVRCDSATMPGGRCSKCLTFNSECTHNMSQTKEGKGTRRLRVMQTVSEKSATATAKAIVNGLLAGTYHAPEDRDALVQLLLQVSHYARGLELATRDSRSPSARASSEDAASEKDLRPEDDNDPADPGIIIDINNLPAHLKQITGDTANRRFLGKNGTIMFVGAAIAARWRDTTPNPSSRLPTKRPKFWNHARWELSPPPIVTYTFPPPDLLRDLVDIYFTQLNIFHFILHRPSFERSLACNLHLREHRFGAVVLAVCALGSKNSSDPRVLLPGEGGLSAGWAWFRQIKRPFSDNLESASLYDLQLCCLYIIFQQIGLNLETCWLLCGIGLLHAQDIGAHAHERPKPNSGKVAATWTVEAELCTRICFYLTTFDAVCSTCFGRPRAANALERALEMPLVCDDEYMEGPDPERAFVQPAGRPALVEYDIAYIKVMGIFTSAKRFLNGGGDPGAIAQIDARLNKWAKEIPEHLLWNPYMADDIFFAQSASLYASYYHAQILLHRPLLKMTIDGTPSPAAFKSLALCANAARSCALVAEVQARRGFLPHTHFLKAVFDATVALVLNISSGTRFGLMIDTERELVDVYKCLSVFRASEARWQNAGRFYDMLCELMNASNLPLPPEVPAASGLDQIALANAEPASWPDELLSLPMAVEDLDRLPIYGSLSAMPMPFNYGESSLASAAPISVPDLSQAHGDGDAGAVDALLQLAYAGSGSGVAGSNNASNVPDVFAGLDSGSSNFANCSGGFGTNMNVDDATFVTLEDAEMNEYLAEWIPYWSGTSALVQAMSVEK
ncbi:hypothetical protein C8R43DRAFT_1049066 [Mycena crocata]|nr:hypothetical protein C8R43DRAFT_1049066 [Mycena crocata]